MKRISLKINLLALDKTRFVDESYVDKNGQQVTKKNLLVDLVVKDDSKILASGDTWELHDVGFITETQTKEEKVAKTNRPIVGGATMFKDKNAVPNFDRDSQGQPIGKVEEEVNLDDIGF
jgi:hypothetical protein